MIEYRDSTEGLRPEMLTGFFVGWRSPHDAEAHLAILRGSDRIALAVDPEAERVVGFATALTDGVQAAFIPLLEVVPEYQGRGIGSELTRRILASLEGIPAVDLTCDPDVQDFYRRFGMQPSTGMVLRNH